MSDPYERLYKVARMEIDSAAISCKEYLLKIEALEAKVKALTDGLRFYANENHWFSVSGLKDEDMRWFAVAEQDGELQQDGDTVGGKRAREVLRKHGEASILPKRPHTGRNKKARNERGT